MKKEIKDVFMELGLKGISPIELYNVLKDIIIFTKEDFEGMRRVFRVRYDQMEIYAFCENINNTVQHLENIGTDGLSIIHIDEIHPWKKIVDSLESREDEHPF